MSNETNSSQYYICDICNHSNLLPEGLSGQDCEQCGYKSKSRRDSAQLTLVFALTALILYIPANFFPFMTIELYGSRNSSTIWSGVVELAESGSWSIAIIVLLASIVIPFLKLLVLFYLSFTHRSNNNPRFKTRLYLMVESIGRWSMLDIFLLAVLVAIMKLGPWTTVRPELGSFLFLLVVIFTMISSAYFDPKLLWKENHHAKERRTENRKA